MTAVNTAIYCRRFNAHLFSGHYRAPPKTTYYENCDFSKSAVYFVT